jgi:uncharacterized protein
LVECGARTKLWHAAALGRMTHIEDYFATDLPASSDQITEAFYQACAGGQREAAEYLVNRGANINWIPPWAKGTPLDAARKHNSATDHPPRDSLVEWLLSRGTKSAMERD